MGIGDVSLCGAYSPYESYGFNDRQSSIQTMPQGVECNLFPSSWGVDSRAGMKESSSKIPVGEDPRKKIKNKDEYNEYVEIASQEAAKKLNIKPEQAEQILSFRVAVLQNSSKLGGLDNKEEAGETISKLVEFVDNYMKANGGQIPKTYEEYVAGVEKTFALDMKKQGNMKPLPVKAFDPKDNSAENFLTMAKAYKEMRKEEAGSAKDKFVPYYQKEDENKEHLSSKYFNDEGFEKYRSQHPLYTKDEALRRYDESRGLGSSLSYTG